MIILFFVGLIIMVSGSSISAISHITCLQLVFNIIGGIMMGGSSFVFIKKETEKQNELKTLINNLAGKEEFANEIEEFKQLKKSLEEYTGTLEKLNQAQVETLAEVCETLTDKFQKLVDFGQKQYRNITDDINGQVKNSSKNLKSLMDEIRDSSNDSNEEMTTKIAELAKQYESFKEFLSQMMERMDHMAEEDIKTIKGFLNG